MRRWAVRIGITTVLIAIAVLLVHQLVNLDPAKLKAELATTTRSDFAIALLFSALSYAALIGYDACALYTISGRAVAPSTIAIGSFSSYAIGHTLGFPLVTAGAVRWRIYGRAGLSFGDVARLTVIANITLWMGLFVVFGVAMVFQPVMMSMLDHLSLTTNKLIGVAILLALAGFAGWCGTGERSFGKGSASIPLPDAKTVTAQIVLGFIDVGASAAALWVFLPATPDMSFLSFTAIFSAAIVLAMVSHAPAGLGAFEAIVIVALPNTPLEEKISALLLWRLTYTLIPFACAILLFGTYETVTSNSPVGRTAKHLRRLAEPFIPPVLGGLTFIGGLVLLASGAIPNEEPRINLLVHFVPLPFSEASHLVGSAAGVVLLILSHGLMRRLQTAWFLTALTLTAGIAVSLIKGLDWEEAAILAIVLTLLLLFRTAFYRKGALFSEIPSKRWIAVIALVILASVWIGFLAYSNVDYRNQLWWKFSWHDDASRFLRASAAAVIVCAGIGLYALINRPPNKKGAEPAPVERLGTILKTAQRADAHLALLGDKRFLFHPEGDAFVMYRVQGKSWIVMGDPVGAPERARDLMWQFLDEVDRNGGWPVFYQISPENLPLYLDGGFSLAKLGEEARVDLERFTIDGKVGRDWRLALNRAERENLETVIVPSADVRAILPELREVSDIWLSQHNTSEKGFSIGFWSEDYLSRFDVVTIRRGGKIVAFAKIWYGAPSGEITVDMVRYLPDESGVMDLLFLNVILYGKKLGYRWFNLGMAPLSGLSNHRLAPSWHKIAAFVARNGERFYGFAGLRAYKSKFKPHWEPRYLAYPGGWMLPQILLDVTALISGGVTKTISK